jgi:superfamily I DNA and RNA helicase
MSASRGFSAIRKAQQIMPLEVVITTDRYRNDPSSREMVEHLRREHIRLGLQAAIVYYDFPTYIDYASESIRPDILILSAKHGLIAIKVLDDSYFINGNETVRDLDLKLGDFCSNLYARLLRSRELRSSRTTSVISIHPVILNRTNSQKKRGIFDDIESIICDSYQKFDEFLDDIAGETLGEIILSEARSVVEGAKALTRPQKRTVRNPDKESLAVALATLESQIANFDEKQRLVALADVGGPARIRGLAGSGKTIILAMKGRTSPHKQTAGENFNHVLDKKSKGNN